MILAIRAKKKEFSDLGEKMMRKNGTSRSILTSAFVFGLSLFLASCGGGGGDGGGGTGATGSITLAVDASTLPADNSSSAIITAKILDSAGNPVPHYTDVLFKTTLGHFRNQSSSYSVQTQPPLDANGWPDWEAAPTGLAQVALIAGKTPGTAKITVNSNNVSQSVYIAIGGQAVTLKLEADPTKIPADGLTSTEIKATLTDGTGSPVTAGTEVSFTTNLGTFVNGAQNYTAATSDATGILRVALIASTTAGSARVVATSNNVTQALYVGFGGKPVSITLTADPAEIAADGESTSTITATITDANGAAVIPGTLITFTTTLGSFLNGSKTYSVETADTTGIVKVSLVSSTGTGSARVAATSNGVSQTIYIGFGGAPVAMTIAATPTTIWADGKSSSAIQVSLTDGTGAAVTPGTLVTFTTSLGAFSNGSSSYTVSTQGSSGIVTVSLISGNSTGLALVSATSNGVTQSVYVTFTEKGGNPFSIILAADPTSIPADGSTSTKITATLTDSAGNPANPGASVTFSTTLGKFSNGAKSYTVTTPDLTGIVSVSLIAETTAGSALVTATANGVTQSISVTFEGGAVSIVLKATPTSIPADGKSSTVITATLTDMSGTPVNAGTSVQFTTTLGTFNNASQTITVTTPDDTGIVSVALIAGTTAGNATVSALSNSVSQAIIVQFTGGGPVAPASLSLGISQTSVKSDNSNSSTVTATVLDGNNAVIEGITVSFTASGGQISAPSAVTDANGQAKIIFSSGTSDPTNRTATITATVSGLTPETIPIQVTGSTLTLSTDKTTITDDGSTTASLTVAAADAGGTGVYNAAVSFAVTGAGGATVTPSSGNTNVSGQLTVTVTGTSAGSVTVTATGLGTTAAQAYTVTGVGTGFAIILPTADPFSTRTRTTTSLAITSPLTSITFNDKGAAADTITSASAFDITKYAKGDVIMVGGSTSNDGVYTLSSTVAPAADTLTLVAGDSLIQETSADVTVTNGVLVRVRAPSPTTDVVFATTIGVWDGGLSPIKTISKTPPSNHVWAVLTSSQAGSATVQVYDNDNSATTDKTTVVFSAPSADAAKITLQASTYVVAPSTGDTIHTATLTATVKTSSGQVVSGAPVAFSIENPTGGGETVSPVVVLTDTSGVAKATFTSGSLSSGAQGVTINATLTNVAVTTSVSIVIGGTAGSVVIGRGTTIYDQNDATYYIWMSVLVSDSNGNPVNGAVVTLSAWPIQYSSGVWYDTDPTDTDIYTSYITGTFPNEDVNENLILDPGEDTNGDGKLTPPSSAAGDVPTTVTTAENGVVQFKLVFLKSSARWIVDRIRASTVVQGTETTSSMEFRLPVEKVESEAGFLPDSSYPIGLVTSTAAPVVYTFPIFRAATTDSFGTTSPLSAGSSSVVPTTRVYTYDPTGGTATVVGNWVWDWIYVVNSASTMSAYFPVRIIIQ